MSPSGSAEVRMEAILSRIFAEMPFAGDAGLIASVLEGFAKSDEFLVEDLCVFDGNEFSMFRFSSVRISYREDAMTWTVLSGHEAGARRSAVGGSGIGIGKSNAFFSEAVDIWSLVKLGALAGEISVAEVIGVDKNDV